MMDRRNNEAHRSAFETGEKMMMLQLKHIHVVEVFRIVQATLTSEQYRLGFLLSTKKRFVGQYFGRVDSR